MIDQQNSLSEKFLKKGFWLYLFSFIIAPIGYVIKIIISGDLTVSEVGILYGIISLITMISAYNDLGITESLNHFIPQFITEKRYDKVKSILFYAIFTQIFTSIIIACFFFFGADYIAINYFKTPDAINTLKVFSLFFIGTNIFQTLSSFFMSVQDTFNQKIISFIKTLFTMLFILFIFFGDSSSLLYYSYSWVIGLYIGVTMGIIIFYKKYYNSYLKSEKILLDKKLIKKITKYASLVFLGASAGTILGQIDMQMIIYMLGTQDAGYYTNYLSIISIPFMIITPIFGLLFPIISEMHSKKEIKKINTIKQIFSKNFIIIGIMFNIFFFVFAEILAFTLFGEKFIQSGIILKYSILLLVFNFLLQINFNIMAGIGKVKERVKIIFFAMIFNIITNLLFINIFGVQGAALATGIGWFIIWILSELNLDKTYRINFNFYAIIKNITILGLLGFLSNEYIIIIIKSLMSDNLTRLDSLIILAILFFIRSIIFILINYKEVNIFFREIKKIKG